jgi:two-component system, NtrC family, response regulator HydG
VLQALERCEARAAESSSTTPTAPTTGPSLSVAAPATFTGGGMPVATGSGKPAGVMAMPMTGPAPGTTMALHGPGTSVRLGGGHEPIPTVAGVVGPSGGSLSVHTPVPPPTSSPRLDLAVRELGLIGNDPSWRQVVELAATIAASRSPVLIAGEPGTGKSQLARLIHSMGMGNERPFIGCEAASLADELSPDDAERPDAAPLGPADSAMIWAARLNLARGGSLYIEDIADLPVALQLLLLRDLQFRDYGAVAGYSSTGGDVRFIMASCESLPSLIDQGRFRQELYHRISVIVLTPPPLRHRGTDIELLAEAFRDRYAQEFHKNVGGFTRDALDVLQRHDWPGNVRELEAAIQRAVAMCNGPRISSNHLAPILNHRQSRAGGGTPRPHLPMGIRPLKEALEEPEKRIIIQALQAFNWNRQETARVLDINRTTLYKKMKKYGLLIDEPMWAQ